MLLDILWIRGMAGTAIERSSSLIQHWEQRLEFCRLHVELRLRPGLRRAPSGLLF